MNKRKEINHQYYKQKKEPQKKYLNAIKKLDHEYESTIKNLISTKNIMIKYLDEQEKGINSVSDKI